MMGQKTLSSQAIKEMVALECQPQDLLRLVMIAYLSCKTVPPQIQALETKLTEKQQSALKHIKQHLGIQSEQ